MGGCAGLLSSSVAVSLHESPARPCAPHCLQTAAGPGGCFTLRSTTPAGMALRGYLPLWGAPPASVTVRLDGLPVAAPGVDGDYVFVDGIPGGAHELTTC